MLVVIEGCDGVGKSTLAANLAQRMGEAHTRMMHYGPPVRHPLEEYVHDLEWYRPMRTDHVVVDRLHYGELIYGPLYRGETKLGTAGRDYVDMFLRTRGAVIVYVRPSPDHRQRMTERGEDYLKEEDVTHVLEAYERVAADAVVIEPIVVNGYPTDEDVTRIVRQARREEHRADHVGERFTTLVGEPLLPEILLLGERRAEVRKGRPEYTSAFVPYPDTSGYYLLGALPRRRLPEIALANACEEDVHQLWRTLGRPRVVTLGRQAEKECLKAGVPHGVVPHPQYVRRFHNGRQVEYGMNILEAAETHDDLTHRWRQA